MSLQVSVTFPGKMNVSDFAGYLDMLKKLGCEVQFGELAPVSKSVAGRQFNRSMKVEREKPFEVAQAITPGEQKIMDQVMVNNFRDGTSPLLDELTRHAVGKLKPNMTREITLYYKENPGHTGKQGAGFLAEKFVAHYKDINDAFVKIRRLIDMACHSKKYKSLEKRGGQRGPGVEAQIYAL